VAATDLITDQASVQHHVVETDSATTQPPEMQVQDLTVQTKAADPLVNLHKKEISNFLI
jgi:hypothetical protein